MKPNDRPIVIAASLLIALSGLVSVALVVEAVLNFNSIWHASPGAAARDAGQMIAVAIAGLVALEYGVRRAWREARSDRRPARTTCKET